MGARVHVALACAVLAAGAALLVLRDRGAAAPPRDAAPRGRGAPGELVAGGDVELAEVASLAEASAAERVREAVVPSAPDPQAPEVVRVRAVDPDGTGVAGATVTLSPWSRDRPVLATATTHAAGRAALVPAGGPLERFRVGYGAPGYVGGSRDCAASSEEIEVRLRWTASIAGVARNAASGRPLAGATIEVGASAATSAADGRYRIDGLPLDARLAVRARCPGFVLRGAGAVLPARGVHPLDLDLEPARPLAVQVVDRATREPIAGAELAERAGGRAIARTDGAGLAAVDVLPGAELELVASAPDHASFGWTWDVDERTAVTLPLVRIGWVEGTVRRADGTPLADAYVACKCAEHHWTTVPLSAEARDALDVPGTGYDLVSDPSRLTDADGAYRIPAPPCGEPLTVTAFPEGLPRCSAGPLAPPPPGGRIRADLWMVARGGVHGRVTRNGEPWAGAIVAAVGLDEQDAFASLRRRDRTDDDGRYALDDLPAGPVQLELRTWIGGAPLATASVLAEPGALAERSFDWTRETPWIRGRVVAPDGSPRADVKVQALAHDHDDAWHAGDETDADGAFALEVAAGAVYDVQTYDERAGFGKVDDVRAGADGVELVLPWSGTVHLQLLVAATGEPPAIALRDFRTGAWRPSGEPGFRDLGGRVDVYGRFAAELEAGTVDLRLHFPADGYAPATLHGIAVPANGETEPIVVRLEHGVEARLVMDAPASASGLLDGHVVFLLEEGQLGLVEGPIPDDAPGPNDRIGGIRMRIGDPLLRSQRVDPAETAVQVFRGLAPGRYHLRAFPDGVAFEPASFDVPAADGDPVTIRCSPHP
jgi:hypothetical protein